MADLSAITAMVEGEAQALGFDLVRVRWFAGDEPTLQVMAERPDTGQLTIDDCAALSRRLSDLFDALEAEGRDPFEAAYRLEVSSPGIDRPLTRAKDFADWAGHDARVTLSVGAQSADGSLRKNLTGTIGGEADGIVRFADRKGGALSFAVADVADAKLLLTDRLIAASRPLDTSGADEFETEQTPAED